MLGQATLTRILSVRRSGSHRVVAVAADGRAPGADEVNILVAVDVVGVRALDAVEDDRVAAH